MNVLHECWEHVKSIGLVAEFLGKFIGYALGVIAIGALIGLGVRLAFGV